MDDWTERMDDWSDRFTPVDLFLFDHWDATATEPIVEQRSRLFNDYVKLGSSGRLPYFQRLKNLNSADPMASQVENLRTQVRTADERNRAARLHLNAPVRLLLRTCYTREFGDSDYTQMCGIGNTGLLFDQSKYDFGEAWEKALLLYPEIVDSMRRPESANQVEQQHREYFDLAEDETLSSTDQDWLRVTGHLVVQDAESDQGIADDASYHLLNNTGNLLYIWLDEFGGVVRQKRGSFRFGGNLMGMMNRCNVEKQIEMFGS